MSAEPNTLPFDATRNHIKVTIEAPQNTGGAYVALAILSVLRRLLPSVTVNYTDNTNNTDSDGNLAESATSILEMNDANIEIHRPNTQQATKMIDRHQPIDIKYQAR